MISNGKPKQYKTSRRCTLSEFCTHTLVNVTDTIIAINHFPSSTLHLGLLNKIMTGEDIVTV
jgi:hypothetical protein